MREGRWDRKLYSGSELSGKTLAILGMGRIGREVGVRMKSFGMRIIGFDPITTAEQAKEAGIEKMELDEIWPIADFITVHVPLIPSTRSINEHYQCTFSSMIIDMKYYSRFFRSHLHGDIGKM